MQRPQCVIFLGAFYFLFEKKCSNLRDVFIKRVVFYLVINSHVLKLKTIHAIDDDLSARDGIALFPVNHIVAL